MEHNKMILTTSKKHNEIARSIPERIERLTCEARDTVHAYKTVNTILLERHEPILTERRNR